MDSAKAKVNEFLHKGHKHDTTVHEKVNPSVTHETVKPHQHENVTTAVDKEVHQDHYHTSVQPVHDKKVLPEQHHVEEHPTVSREFHHGDDREVSRALHTESAKFKDESVKTNTTTSQTEHPTVANEHVHHHVHENIQPVVHKETVEPHVVHSVNKVHEKHHNPAQVHETHSLPPMNMTDFKARGGHLNGRGERMDEFDGCPRNVHGTETDKANPLSHDHHSHNGTLNATPHTTTAGTTTTNSSIPNTSTKRDSAIDSEYQHKPSLKDKLNPKVDADGDGKAGVMN